MRHYKQNGFTLIELLVVIAIIGLLSTLAVVSLNGARAKARDARRVADLKAVQSALELYRGDSTTDAIPLSAATWATSLVGLATYLPAGVPVDPTAARTATQTYVYCGEQVGVAYNYLLSATLENAASKAGGIQSGTGNYGTGKCANEDAAQNDVNCAGATTFCLGSLSS